jgi:hypothetical protein
MTGTSVREIPLVDRDSIHILRDTANGAVSLCGREAVFGVYSGEVSEYPNDVVCSQCRRLRVTES